MAPVSHHYYDGGLCIAPLLLWWHLYRTIITMVAPVSHHYCDGGPCIASLLRWWSLYRTIIAMVVPVPHHYCDGGPCAAPLLRWWSLCRTIIAMVVPVQHHYCDGDPCAVHLVLLLKLSTARSREYENSVSVRRPQPHTTNQWKDKNEKIVGETKRDSRLGQQEGIGSARKTRQYHNIEHRVIKVIPYRNTERG